MCRLFALLVVLIAPAAKDRLAGCTRRRALRGGLPAPAAVLWDSCDSLDVASSSNSAVNPMFSCVAAVAQRRSEALCSSRRPAPPWVAAPPSSPATTTKRCFSPCHHSCCCSVERQEMQLLRLTLRPAGAPSATASMATNNMRTLQWLNLAGNNVLSAKGGVCLYAQSEAVAQCSRTRKCRALHDSAIVALRCVRQTFSLDGKYHHTNLMMGSEGVSCKTVTQALTRKTLGALNACAAPVHIRK